MSRLTQHICCWECPLRTSEIVYHLLDQIRTPSAKVGIFLQLLDPLLSLNDSLKTMRVNLVLSPFRVSYPYMPYSATGMIGIMKSEERHTLILLQFILYLALRTREEPIDPERVSAYCYILHRRFELFWMKDFLLTKLDSTNESIPKNINDKELLEAEEIVKRYPPFGTTNVVTNRHLYLVLVKLTSISPSNDTPIFWKRHESELINKIQNLQSDIEKVQLQNVNLKSKLQKIQEYYLSNCPDIKPPDTVEEQGSTWKLGIVSGNARKGIGPQRPQMGPSNYESPEIGPVIAQPSATNAIVPYNESSSDTEMIDRPPPLAQATIIPLPPERDPDFADSKVKEIREIFSDTPEDVVKVALRNCNWSIDRTIDEMLNEVSKTRFTQEAMERRKQKQKPAQELSPN